MDLQRQISEFVERLHKALGESLVSVVLYGSSATGNYVEKRSDVNLLCVLERVDEGTLNALSGIVQWWSKEIQHRPPMVLTLSELKDSADVFAIETLDIKAQNKLLFGRDVLTQIEIPMNLHRVQVEHELRILLLRLRQHYILAQGKQEDMEKALAHSASSAATLLRHAVIVVTGDAPSGARQALPRVSEVFGMDLSPMNAVLDLHDGRRVESDINNLYRDYMGCLDSVVEKINLVVPKKQLQRASQQ